YQQLKQLPRELMEHCMLMTVVNKSDLPAALEVQSLPGWLGKPIQTSAMTNQGIDKLRQAIMEISGVRSIQPDRPIVFTQRQRRLLNQLVGLPEGDPTQTQRILRELLYGPLNY
ncbi:MAG: hypothetical protein QHH07_12140, partial [Sedimentisphaerales bacterium]|nr:hypothetical protein [Sedimentisphaerales bacterium]